MKKHFYLGTMEFMGHADLPQQAKHNASVQALPYLHQMPDIMPPAKAAAIPKNSQGRYFSKKVKTMPRGSLEIQKLCPSKFL